MKNTESVVTERILRECDCPPWVERCAHFGSKFVQLCRADLLKNPDTAATWTTPFTVDGPSDLPSFVSRVISKHKDHETALAAFHEAEEALLRGGSW